MYFQRKYYLCTINKYLTSMYIPKYFKLSEFTRSYTARKKGIDNTPTKAVTENLLRLIETVLDPAREEYGAPIIVSSGYRCDALNRAVGGVGRSQHLLGLAADIQCIDLPRLFLILKQNRNIDQLLFEYKKKGNNLTRWLHVSIAAKGNAPRRQIFPNYKA